MLHTRIVSCFFLLKPSFVTIKNYFYKYLKNILLFKKRFLFQILFNKL